MKNNKAFTLLEVMLTVGIIAVLSVLAARTIQQSLKAKQKIQGQIDDLSRIRDALRLMERDIALTFHYRDIEEEIATSLKKQSSPTQQPPPNQPLTPEPTREAPRQNPVTQFLGTNDSMNFVTMNNSRIQANSRQADFVEVGYSLRECQNKKGGKCLWRRMSPVVDSDVSQGGNELALLEHIEELTFKYIGKGKQEWGTAWSSDDSGDAVTKNNFPAAVEISLTYKRMEGEAEKKYSMQIVAPLHFPNNREEGSSATNSASPTAQSPGK